MIKEIIVDEAFIKAMEVYRKPCSKNLFEACSKNVIVFAEKMLGIKLYAWQVWFLNNMQKILEGKHTYKEALALTSRQIGKSTSLAIFSLWTALFNKKPATIHNNTEVCIVSRSDTQAKKLLREVRKIYRYGDKHMRDTYLDADNQSIFGRDFFSDLLSNDDPNNTTNITFKPYDAEIHGEYLLKDSKSGSHIVSYPPTPVVLGESFGIGMIDEAGHEKITDDFFKDELYPTGDSTNAIFIYTSTPWKPSGFFYEFCDMDDNGYNNHIFKVKFTIEALRYEKSERAQEQYNKVKENIKRMELEGDLNSVRRSYYCEFVKGELNYFDPEKVPKVFDDYKKVEEYKEPCDMGVDFGGQVKSRTVITISTLNQEGVIMRLYDKVYEVGKDLTLLDDIEYLLTKFNIQRIIPDDCPAGDYLIRKMIEEKGWNVTPMNFRAEKVKKYGAFRASLNKNKLKSYKDDELKKEMLAMEYSQASKQSIIQHAAGYSDDRIDSFVMSCYHYIQDEGGVKTYDW